MIYHVFRIRVHHYCVLMESGKNYDDLFTPAFELNGKLVKYCNKEKNLN